MGARSWRLVLLSLCLFFNSAIGTAEILRDEENQEISYEFSTQLDSVPIVNPTTPGTANPSPTLNPTTPPAPDTTGQTPPTPTTTPPYMTPTTPTTSPNTNPTTPTNPYTTPTNPYTTPTTTSPATPSANPTTPTSPTPTTSGGGGQWCVASPSAQDKALKVALDYACGYGADCSAIQPGASCYNPNTLKDHASYAFNDYYQKNPAPTSCAFGGTATLTNKDPGDGNCHYSSSKTPSTSPPTYVSPPNALSPPTPGSTMTPTTPSTMTPTTPSMTIPGGASVYGPTGSPNIATSASHSVLLLFALFGLWVSLHVENYI